MKSRVLGLACAAGLAAGCQSSASRALSRYQDSKAKTGDVAQVSHEAAGGLPGPSKKRAENARQSPEQAFEMGEKSLQQFYRDRQDKPAHLQRARVNFEEAAKGDPAFAAPQHRLAIIADLQERFGESESYYLTALSLDPDNSNIAADLGWSYILQGRWQDAERALMRALELDPNSTIARDHLAKCKQHQTTAQVASSSRGPAGQMMANRPATVGPDSSVLSTNTNQGHFADPGRRLPGTAPDRVGEYLRGQLAEIDQYRTQPAGQPLTLDPRQPAPGMPPVQPQQYPGAPAAYVQAAQPQYHGDPGAQGGSPQPGHAPETQFSNRSEPRPSSQPFMHIEPGGSPQRSMQANAQSQGTSGNLAGHGQTQRGPANEWSRQGNGSAIQRTQSLEPPVLPDQAVYQAPQLPVLPPQMHPGDYPQQQIQQEYPPSVPPTGYGQSMQQPTYQAMQPPAQQQMQQPNFNNAQPQAPSFDRARRDAALMGLGLGPGQLFPSLEQPADRMSPGTNSQTNGAAFGAPPIHSPDLTPPPDLRQMPSFFEQSPATPPTNSMGQTMPGGTSNMMTPGSANDPNARFQQGFVHPAAGQSPQMPALPNVWNDSGNQGGMQGYDDTRRAADLQLQQTLQNTWASTPSGAIPSPSAGVPMQGPPPQSQMMNDGWRQQAVAPAPYPHTAPQQQQQSSRGFDAAPLPAVNPSPGRMQTGQFDQYPPAGRLTQPVYRNGVVLPEHYSPVR